MSELLRLANELVSMDGNVECGDSYPCPYAGSVVTVIKGYQDLLRGLAEIADDYDSNIEPWLSHTLADLRKHLPQDNPNE